ncbi:MAG: type II toxin-antitoxin system VapC family toxin [Rickettsiales bacterium]|nr:MAG: type II toxin-antitoxin system VapC family toxin [Rickettsiales bacterium]
MLTKYLLDTNVISEIRKTDYCNPNVDIFIKSIKNSNLFLSSVIIGEIWYGIERMIESKKKQEYKMWYQQITTEFKDNILTFDKNVAETWGFIRAKSDRTLSILDSQIGATAMHYNLTLLTRNVKDFKSIEGLKIVNPWE